MSVYKRSVSNCVSFPCVVYFCLFSPLKDRYAFSICLQLLGAKPPDSHRGSAPGPRCGTSVPQTPCFASPLANFWLRPLQTSRDFSQSQYRFYYATDENSPCVSILVCHFCRLPEWRHSANWVSPASRRIKNIDGILLHGGSLKPLTVLLMRLSTLLSHFLLKLRYTLKVVPTPTITAEKDLAQLTFSSHSLSTHNNIYNRVCLTTAGDIGLYWKHNSLLTEKISKNIQHKEK